MSDREMLELAAKAAGIDYHATREDGTKCIRDGRGYWNPLTDDGDALRLAVKCKIDLVFVTQYHDHAEVVFVGDGEVKHELSSDPLAATRRAIVRAAAEIGRGIAQQTARADLPEDNYYKTMAEAEETGRTAAKIGMHMK